MSLHWPSYWADFPEIPEQAAAVFSDLTASDGVQLQVCQFGEPARECIVVLNPPMFLLLLWLPTLIRISRLMPVVAWEPRGWDSPTPIFDPTQHSVERYARDAEEIAAERGLDLVHLVSVCAGSDTAMELVYRRTLNVGSVALITPPLPLPVEQVRNERARAVGEYIRMILTLADAEDKLAEGIFRRLQRLESLVRAPVDLVSQRLGWLNLSTLDHARQYARAFRAFSAGMSVERRQTLFQVLYESVATHLVCVEDDEVVGCPREFPASARGNLTIDVYPTGGHAVAYNPDIVYSSLLKFYRSKLGLSSVSLL